MAIGGGKNAGLFAVRILAVTDPSLSEKLSAYEASLRAAVSQMNDDIAHEG